MKRFQCLILKNENVFEIVLLSLYCCIIQASVKCASYFLPDLHLIEKIVPTKPSHSSALQLCIVFDLV